MSDRVTGTLQINDRVLLQRPGGDLEVIALPLQAAIGWEEIVRRSIEAFQALDGEAVTLEGDLHGGLLASARVVEATAPRSGTYRGRIEAEGGQALLVDLRLDLERLRASADFFLGPNYHASLRTALVAEGGGWRGAAPRVIFDWQDSSSLGGLLEVTSRGGDVLDVTCLLPESLPVVYGGSVSRVAETFRSLQIEVDKLDGMPWPPELASRDIPGDQQPAGLPEQELSLAALFRKAGIDAHVHHNDGALDDAIGRRAGRPAEGDRWDEREMHEMMQAHYSRPLTGREWWLYLLVVPRFDGGPLFSDGQFLFDEAGEIRNGGEGTTGIIFDSRTGAVTDPWSVWLPQILPQFRHLFDFGRAGGFENVRARQGVAVFWRELDDIFGALPGWDRDRRFLRTIVHELGHALNLAHAWLVNRSDSTSFMQYPQRFPHGATFTERDRNYWLSFNYAFDPEEVFHFCHGFYNEVIPGGRNEFMSWTPSSVFRDPTAGGTRSDLSLTVTPGKDSYRFTEPVTVDVTLANHSPAALPVGRLSPAYGNVRYLLRRPDGRVVEYQPPLYKCEAVRDELPAGETRSHTTSLTVGAGGFTFDTPGRYELTAVVPDPGSGVMVVSRPAPFWVRYPEPDDERIAQRVFDREPGLFLYLAGGEHLAKGKAALEEVSEEYPDHPFAAHAQLVLGLNALAGQKRVPEGIVTRSKPQEAEKYFAATQATGELPESLTTRLQETVRRCIEEPDKPKGGGKSKGKKGDR